MREANVDSDAMGIIFLLSPGAEEVKETKSAAHQNRCMTMADRIQAILCPIDFDDNSLRIGNRR